MASGCGDRQRIAETWSVADYYDVKRVWDEVAPPPYISLAAMIGYKPKAPQMDPAAGRAQTPEEAEALIRAMLREGGIGGSFEQK